MSKDIETGYVEELLLDKHLNPIPVFGYGKAGAYWNSESIIFGTNTTVSFVAVRNAVYAIQVRENPSVTGNYRLHWKIGGGAAGNADADDPIMPVAKWDGSGPGNKTSWLFVKIPDNPDSSHNNIEFFCNTITAGTLLISILRVV